MPDRSCLRHADVVVLVATAIGLSACGSGPVASLTPQTQGLKDIGVEKRRDEKAAADASGVSAMPTSAESLGGYVAYALENSPAVKAAFEKWRAARFQISRAGQLPEPMISFGYYLRSAETRVGPQRFHVGISQRFPWPGTLGGGEDAARERANALALVFDAQALKIKRDVADAYWSLWLIQEEHRLKSEHDAVLESLVSVVRGRLQVGGATLADLSQVDLNIARHHDHLGQHEQAEKQASAQLVAVLGAPSRSEILEVRGQPLAGLPQRSLAELHQIGAQHPSIERFSRMAASEDQKQEVARKNRYPKLSFGLKWIETGDEGSAVDSGKDAVILSGGLSVPLWTGSYSDGIEATQAMAKGHRLEREAMIRRFEADITRAFSNIQDADRRIKLYARTLIPQAQGTLQAVLGSYQTGRSTIASVILAQRDLIELRLQHVRAQAAHTRAWAHLEFLTGTELDSTEGQND